MAIPAQTPTNSYTANGVATEFAYTFKIFTESDLEVKLNGTVKTITTHYTVSGVGESGGGIVTFLSAPANGVAVVFNRIIPYDRDTDYQTSGDLLANTLDDDLDRTVCQLQQINYNIDAYKAAVDASEAAFIVAVNADQDAFEAAITLQQDNYETTITNQQNAFEITVNNNVASKANVDNTVLTGNIVATLTAADNDLFSIKDSGGTGLFTVSATGTAGLRDKLTVGSLAIASTDVTATAAELNKLAGTTATTADFNKLHDVTASAAELSIMDGVTASAAEISTLTASGITNADLVKLHALTPTAAKINQLESNTFTTGIVAPNIKISGTASSDKNTLDFYEEGDVTFTADDGAGNLVGGITIANYSKYVRLGKMVQVNISVEISGTGSGAVYLKGLPFALPAANPAWVTAPLTHVALTDVWTIVAGSGYGGPLNIISFTKGGLTWPTWTELNTSYTGYQFNSTFVYYID